ncbi:MAG: polyprenyl synthetase family protein [Firmicutes bacterium]|nr:polyprenyl synthetase family protein [Bacillota bacterium]
MTEFWQGYAQASDLFEADLRRLFADKLEGYCVADDFTPARYDVFFEALEYAVYGGGKRLRPLLLLEFARIFGAAREDALPYAAALELIHCYSLAHDDLPCMDDDDYRRGKPSLHKKYGEYVAVLAGDALLNMAYEILFESDYLDADAAAAIAVNAGAGRMIGGQFLDIQFRSAAASYSSKEVAPTLDEICAGKTAGLFAAACLAGAYLGGTNSEKVKRAGAFGRLFGRLFQLADDYTDYLAGKDETSLFRIFGLERGRDAATRAEDEMNAAVDALAASGLDVTNLTSLVCVVCDIFEN